ncbi:MAG: hypothetical protein VW378_07710 [bacterium]
MKKKIRNLLLLIQLATLWLVNIQAEEYQLHYFNKFQTRTSITEPGNNQLSIYFLKQNWTIALQDPNSAIGQSIEEFSLKKDPVFYPNPFQVRDNPQLQFAISKISQNEFNNLKFEIRAYDYRGFEIIRKSFFKNDKEFVYNDRSDVTYINLHFEEAELKEKFSSGGYVYLLLKNNDVIAKGQFAVKPQ